LIILIISSIFFVRPFKTTNIGNDKCMVVIWESDSGLCIGFLKSVNITSELNKDFPDCRVNYSGNECKGIKLFRQQIAAN